MHTVCVCSSGPCVFACVFFFFSPPWAASYPAIFRPVGVTPLLVASRRACVLVRALIFYPEVRTFPRVVWPPRVLVKICLVSPHRSFLFPPSFRRRVCRGIRNSVLLQPRASMVAGVFFSCFLGSRERVVVVDSPVDGPVDGPVDSPAVVQRECQVRLLGFTRACGKHHCLLYRCTVCDTR